MFRIFKKITYVCRTILSSQFITSTNTYTVASGSIMFVFETILWSNRTQKMSHFHVGISKFKVVSIRRFGDIAMYKKYRT